MNAWYFPKPDLISTNCASSQVPAPNSATSFAFSAMYCRTPRDQITCSFVALLILPPRPLLMFKCLPGIWTRIRRSNRVSGPSRRCRVRCAPKIYTWARIMDKEQKHREIRRCMLCLGMVKSEDQEHLLTYSCGSYRSVRLCSNARPSTRP